MHKFLRPYRKNGIRGKIHTKHTSICKLINVKTFVLLYTGIISVLWLKVVRVFEWHSVHGRRESRLVKKCGVSALPSSTCPDTLLSMSPLPKLSHAYKAFSFF